MAYFYGMKRASILFLLYTFVSLTAVFAQEKPAFQRDNVNTVLWEQRSGEYRALCFQAYEAARFRLKENLVKNKSAKPKCVVVDVDETVLDNSPFQAYELRQGRDYDQKDWQEWTAKAVADTVPGALAFLKFAAQNKVETFYVTNRNESEREATLKNLKKWKFPFADNAHLLLKSNVSSDKEPRRAFIAQKYDIVLLCGDNLNDFSGIFFTKDESVRNAKTELSRSLFGHKFIVLPNPMYGDWMDALYDGKKGLTEQEKGDMRLKKLKSY